MHAYKAYKEIFAKKQLENIFIEHISDTKGAGADGLKVSHFDKNLDSELDLIIKRVSARDYKFTRYRQKLILKGPRSFPRVISIATIRDRVTLRALLEIIIPVFTEIKQSRPHRYIVKIKDFIKSSKGNFVAIRIDIKNYYPSIDHELLFSVIKTKIRKVEILDLLKKAVENSTGVSSTKESVGVPQGLSISNALAEIYMLPIDKEIYKATKSLAKTNFLFLRYVDDILIFSEKNKAETIFDSVSSILSKYKLSVHPLNETSSKSSISELADGFDYLGYKITKNGVYVRKSSLNKMYENISKVITRYKSDNNLNKLIFRLNLKITGCVYQSKRLGWLHFFSQISKIQQLKELDVFIEKKISNLSLDTENLGIKRFIKSYYEVVYNSSDTTYIPNFDEFTDAQKIKVIADVKNENPKHVGNWETEKIQREFQKLIIKETKELEKDLVAIS